MEQLQKKNHEKICQPGQMLPSKQQKSNRVFQMRNQGSKGIPSKRKHDEDQVVFTLAKKLPRKDCQMPSVVAPPRNMSAKKKASLQCTKCRKNNVFHPHLKFKCLP
jgi:hypothetical protein